uniref:DNA-directed RNA polymerase subunit beta n=1 Tax=Pedinomonas tuberculata TaxID=160064 RepID=A0A097KL63_9CHLO|nr:beta subunit of RNA polymerase [Pedinomonas tuberculata]AIT93929.1 beta subunit of RNA polymerase [Pedinomonas tuberculata]
MSFNNISKMLTPDFLEIQRISFLRFLESGIIQEIKRRNPLQNSTKEYEIFFYPESYQLEIPEISAKDAIVQGKSYASRLFLPVQLINHRTGSVRFQWIILGTFPLMTKRGHFIINGCPRVIINQLIRSPGVYFLKRFDSQQKEIFYADFICERGAWLRIEMDSEERIWARLKRTPKIPVLILLQSFGISLEKIFSSSTDPEILANSLLPYRKKKSKLKKSKPKVLVKKRNIQNPLMLIKRHPFSQQSALKLLAALIQLRTQKEIVLNAELGKKFLMKKFGNSRSYDLGVIGRIRLNQKLGGNIPLSYRQLTGDDISHAVNYLMLVATGVYSVDDIDHLQNRRVRTSAELLQTQLGVGLLRLEKMFRDRSTFLFQTFHENHAISKDIRSLMSTKPVNGAFKEFFGSSPLSQFLDQTNPLAELTHKRRLSSLGPGGVSRETAGMAVRGIHPSHYGRICPIETPEGQNAGLVNSLTVYSTIDKNGFIQTPFYSLSEGQIQHEKNLTYLSSQDELLKTIVPGDIYFNSLGFVEDEKLPSRKNQEFAREKRSKLDYIAVSPLQMISVATSLIPFLEHDDANRALMGSNMQRQAVPTIKAERPRIGTGLESKVVVDVGHVVQARWSGYVSSVTSNKIIIESFVHKTDYFYSTPSITISESESSTKTFSTSFLSKLEKSPNVFKKINYHLENYQPSNQSTCFVQKPIIKEGDWIEAGDIIADGSSSQAGELALGHNILVAYMPWQGFNFEDAILISERLVREDLYTSIHIEKYEVEIRETKFGLEKITSKIPEVGKKELKNLDSHGIVNIGTWIKGGDILVGKVTPIRKKPLSAHERLLYDIVGKVNPTVRDSSLRVPKGTQARILDLQITYSEEKNPMKVKILVAQRRRIQVGDKMAGRHGNKGIISKILPVQDMPYLPNGTPMDIVLNPLGVPSRMNVGQVYECLLGLAGRYLNENYRVIPFDELFGSQTSRSLTYSKLYESRLKTGEDWLFNPNCPGKVKLFDGRTGECFDQPITVGEAYILKLVHLVDDKIHARSTGPYSFVTQQPLRGRSKHGGQRLGEMEVWAVEGFGASYILQELLTVKSDDVKGRHKIMYSILTGKHMSMGTPECFKVLVKELQSLCLDVGVYAIDHFGKRQLRDSLDL